MESVFPLLLTLLVCVKDKMEFAKVENVNCAIVKKF